MIVPQETRAFLRERMDDPGPEGGVKIVAARIGINRDTLRVMVKDGTASEMTMRRFAIAYPAFTPATPAILEATGAG